MPLRSVRRAARAGAGCATSIGVAGSGHLLLLLVAAASGRRKPAPRPRDGVPLAVVIPAHDEEAQVGGAVRSVLVSDYDPGRRRVIVVADNCTDQTAAAARAAGAEVWERSDPRNRGKGHALAWAFSRLAEDDSVHGVCVVDADCEVSGNLLGAVAARLGAGADAVQVPYLVSNPDSSAATALRWAGFRSVQRRSSARPGSTGPVDGAARDRNGVLAPPVPAVAMGSVLVRRGSRTAYAVGARRRARGVRARS